MQAELLIQQWRDRRLWTLLALLALLLGIARIGVTTAIFTDTTTNSNNILSSAKLDLATSPASQIYNITDLVPGDTVTRSVTVTNPGTVAFTYRVTGSSSTNTLLWTDTTDGFQLEIKEGAATYFSGPISLLNSNPAADLSLASGANTSLSFKISFPVSAGNTFQNLSETITFTFSATQLPGTAR
ncbi:TasA family protein [Paenibacillus koleovorans]|uniref:TasA family protein n=1 Tax=Paenibacillus koleovorans TaxID=121608 RepID=UPI000FD8D7F7|nr:TasA family protein [Paenibacillus koleovorans]